MSVAGFTLYTWFRRVDASGAEEWMLHNVIPLEGEILQATEIPEDELCEHGLQVFAFLDGIVFMSIYGEDILPWKQGNWRSCLKGHLTTLCIRTSWGGLPF